MNKRIAAALLILAVSAVIGFIQENKGMEQLNKVTNKEVSVKVRIGGEREEPDKPLFFSRPDAFPQQTYIKVYKKDRILELYGDGRLIGRFRIALGRCPEGDKTREGDSRTPEGRYYICTRNSKSQYTLFLGLSYPNAEDAAEGLEKGLISREEYELIRAAAEKQQRPLWNTALGGAVGIHGGGSGADWTQGCIAVSDEDIRLIWEYTSFKTPVDIFE